MVHLSDTERKETILQIQQKLASGRSLAQALRDVRRVPPATYYHWRKRGLVGSVIASTRAELPSLADQTEVKGTSGIVINILRDQSLNDTQKVSILNIYFKSA